MNWLWLELSLKFYVYVNWMRLFSKIDLNLKILYGLFLKIVFLFFVFRFVVAIFTFHRQARIAFVLNAVVLLQKDQLDQLNYWVHVVAVVYHCIHLVLVNWQIYQQMSFHYRFLWRKVVNGYVENVNQHVAHVKRHQHHPQIVIVKEYVC